MIIGYQLSGILFQFMIQPLTGTDGSKALHNIFQGNARGFLVIVVGKSTYGNLTNHRSYLLSMIYLPCERHSVAVQNLIHGQTPYPGSEWKYLLIPQCILTGLQISNITETFKVMVHFM
jgi:hypothetical protein